MCKWASETQQYTYFYMFWFLDKSIIYLNKIKIEDGLSWEFRKEIMEILEQWHCRWREVDRIRMYFIAQVYRI